MYAVFSKCITGLLRASEVFQKLSDSKNDDMLFVQEYNFYPKNLLLFSIKIINVSIETSGGNESLEVESRDKSPVPDVESFCANNPSHV